MNRESVAMSLLPTRTTRIAKASVSSIQDENKAPVGKVVDKKVVKRNVLGDISNVASKVASSKASGKVEKPVCIYINVFNACK